MLSISLSPSLSAAATITDVFNGQRFRRVANTPQFIQTYERHNEGRAIFMGLTYNFGVSRSDKAGSFEYNSEG